MKGKLSMKKNNKFKYMVIALIALLTLSFNFTAFAESQVVKIAVPGNQEPFQKLDENDELTGFDADLLKMIDDALDDYEFEFDIYEWKNLMPALDSGQAQFAVSNFIKTPEREEKYLFSEIPYAKDGLYIMTEKENDFNPQTLADLNDHIVSAGKGGSNEAMIDKFNEEEDGSIEINYSDNAQVSVTNVLNGTTDATLVSKLEYDDYVKNYGDLFKLSEKPIEEQFSYYMFAKGQEKLRDAIDEVLKKLEEDGTLDSLKEKYNIPNEL